MSEIHFEWDVRKARSNVRKHGVSFEEATSVFYDDEALMLDGPGHSEDEERFVLLGLSSVLRILVVVHCFRGGDERVSPHLSPQGHLTRGGPVPGPTETMRDEYDFSNARKNPYAKRLKQKVTIRLDAPTIAYFKSLAEDTGIPYQTLINLYLRDCATSKRELSLDWQPAAKG
jgi:uncharacterized DUF497 family protein/uncharacterized protein (DUF4415 family)